MKSQRTVKTRIAGLYSFLGERAEQGWHGPYPEAALLSVRWLWVLRLVPVCLCGVPAFLLLHGHCRPRRKGELLSTGTCAILRDTYMLPTFGDNLVVSRSGIWGVQTYLDRVLPPQTLIS